jgi:hypothetical protein
MFTVIYTNGHAYHYTLTQFIAVVNFQTRDYGARFLPLGDQTYLCHYPI